MLSWPYRQILNKERNPLTMSEKPEDQEARSNLSVTPSPSCPPALSSRFDLKSTAPFTERSISQATRDAYRRVVNEFFRFFNYRNPAEITSKQILSWREHLAGRRQKPATIAFKLSVIRSLYDFLKDANIISVNPASIKAVPPPEIPDHAAGRALTLDEVSRLLAAPHRGAVVGARDYALMLLMLKTSVRVGEACGIKVSDKVWKQGRWALKVKVKGRSERVIPLPEDVQDAINDYLKLDRTRRQMLRCGGDDAWLFQPTCNYRTRDFRKPISTRMAEMIVKKWADFAGIGKVSPHDLRRTAITRALDQGLSYRQVQMMSGHSDPKTVMRYDYNRENLEMNAINFLTYKDDNLPTKPR